MWTIAITCILFGIIIGYIVGGKEGVDSCEEVFYDNTVFRNTIKLMIEIRNSKELKEKKRKELLYRCIDDLDIHISGDYKRLEKAKELFKEDENETRN